MMEKANVYGAVIIVQCLYAGLMLLSKVAVSSGMKPSVFVAYRQALGFLILLPFAFFFPSKNCPISRTGFCKIILASSWMALSFNFALAGLQYISTTFGMAMFCFSPALVFIMAVCFRIEKLCIREWHGVAKLLGTILAFAGTMAFTFFKGHPQFSNSNHDNCNAHHLFDERLHPKHQWVKGSFLAMWLIMQAPLLKQFPGNLRLTVLQCGFSFVCGEASVLVEDSMEYRPLIPRLLRSGGYGVGLLVGSLRRKVLFLLPFTPLFFFTKFFIGEGCGLMAIGLYKKPNSF